MAKRKQEIKESITEQAPAPEEKPFVPTMTAEEIKLRMAEASVRLTEAKAESEAARARQMTLTLDRECGKLIYLITAEAEFGAKMSPIAAVIRNIPIELTRRCGLTPEQHAVAREIVNGALAELSRIEFHFDTAAEVDARAAASHTSSKGKGVKK